MNTYLFYKLHFSDKFASKTEKIIHMIEISFEKYKSFALFITLYRKMKIYQRVAHFPKTFWKKKCSTRITKHN